MQVNFCLPIIKNNKENILKIIHKNKNDFQYFEVWLDYVKHIDITFLKQLQKLLGDKLILVLRRQNLEKSQMSFEQKKDITSLMHHSRSFLDVDIFDQIEELQLIKSNKLSVKTIISYHNYQETPPESKLKEIVDAMKIHKPTILKIATFCKSKTDALRLLQLLLDLKEKQTRCIILGMGRYGAVTRIFGTLWGNEMIFTPITLNESSAPGQFTKMQLENILKQIGK